MKPEIAQLMLVKSLNNAEVKMDGGRILDWPPLTGDRKEVNQTVYKSGVSKTKSGVVLAPCTPSVEIKRSAIWRHVVELSLTVPKDYSHGKEVGKLKDKTPEHFCFARGELVVDSRTADELVPHQKCRVQIFASDAGTTGVDCVEKCVAEKGLLLGSQGEVVLWRQLRSSLPQQGKLIIPGDLEVYDNNQTLLSYLETYRSRGFFGQAKIGWTMGRVKPQTMMFGTVYLGCVTTIG